MLDARPSLRPPLRAGLGLLVLTLALFGGASRGRAQSFEGAALLGFGGARRALGTGNVALFSNPAGLAAARRYDIELGYADDFREADRRVSLAIADGQAGPVAGGVALTYERLRPPDLVKGPRRLEGLRFDVATAVPVAEGFFLGAGSRFADYRLIDGDEEIEDGGSSAFAFDLGLQWRIAEGFAAGATLRNFTAAEQPGLPRAWGAGLGYQGGPFSVEVDIEHAWESRDPRYTGSAGFVLAERVPLRAALTFDQETDAFTLSVGAGFQVDRFGIDLGYRQTLNPDAAGEDADGRLFVASVRVIAF
jgi:hypothetical protein